jgi:hypothetical protein
MPKKMRNMSVEEVKNKIQKVADFSNYLCPELEKFKMLVEKLRDTMAEFTGLFYNIPIYFLETFFLECLNTVK